MRAFDGTDSAAVGLSGWTTSRRAARGCCFSRRLSGKGGAVRAGREPVRMGARFIGVDREQVFLMPPSVREWVPEGHLVWTVLDAVGELDLSAFYAVYRADGHGRPAYEPSMMVGLLAEPAWPGTTLTMTSLTVDEPSG